MVNGNNNIDDAKIGGITPAGFIFKGKCDACPAKTFLPFVLCGY